MNPQQVQDQVIKQLKKTRSRFTKIIRMVENQDKPEIITREIWELKNALGQTSDLIKLPTISQKINQGKLQEAVKEINRLF